MKTNKPFKKTLISGFSIALVSCLIMFAILLEFFNIDSGLFRNTTCQAPCWNNLIPGQTTMTELDQYLNTLNPWKWTQKRNYQYDNGCRSTRVVQNNITGGVMDFYVEDGTLTFIKLWSSSTPLSNLKKVINHYGPPESIYVILAIGVDGDNYIFEVFYPSKGIAISFYADQEDRGYIKSNMQIWSVEYFPPGDLLSYFITQYSCSFGYEKAIDMAKDEIHNTQPWPGFGEVKPIVITP